MKKILLLFFLASCCIPAAVNAATLSSADFSYCSDVQGAVKAGTLYKVHIADEIIRKTGVGLEDLRLFDVSQKEIPLVVIGNVPPHELIETYPLEVTGYDSEASSAILLMKLPQKHRPISVIDLDIADKDFKKRIALSESSDGKTWQLLTTDSIYDFSSQVSVRRTKLEFPSTDSRYYRLTITDFKPRTETQPSISLKYEGLDFSVNGVQKKELRIRSAQGSTQTPAEKRPVYDQKTFHNLSPTLDKDGNTVIVLPADLPLDKLILAVANPYYHRTINLYGSSTGKEDSFRFLASQVIYRFPLSSEQHEEKNFLEQSVPKQAYYRIVVINRNNPPLEIKEMTLSWIQQNLFFIALQNGERYSLCMGNTRIKRPDYDMANFVNQNTLSQHTYEQVALAPLHATGGPRLTLSERFAGMEKLILKVVVFLLVIGMGSWLYLLMKKAPKK